MGTEHLLPGILFARGGAGQRLAGLGITAAKAERGVVEEIARVQAERRSAG
jgi:hypothetical protein